MARPKPVVLLQHTCRSTHKREEVLASGAIYAVYYKNKPISIRVVHSIINIPGPKYKKTSFPNAGHAFNLSEKLNITHQCNDFTVVKLIDGEIIHEH